MKTRFQSTLLPAVKTTAVIILLVYVILFSSSVPGWFNPVLIALAASIWLIFNRSETGLEGPVLIFFSALLFTSIFSVDIYRSLDQVYRLAVGFLALFLCAGLARRFLTPDRIIGVLLFVGGLAMLWSWLDFARWYSGWLALQPGHWIPEVGFRLNGSNNLAAYYNLLLMVSLAYFFLNRRIWIKILLGLYAFSALALIFLTTSRGGWVGTAAGLVIIAMFLLFKNREGVRRLWLAMIKRRTLLIGLVVVIAAGLSGIGYLAFKLLGHPTHGDFLISRSDFWPTALKMFNDSPIWGLGLATYPSFRLQAFSFPPSPFFLHAHNQYLDILAGSGLIGAAAFGWLIVGFVRAFKSNFRGLVLDSGAASVGAVACLAAFVAHGFFDGLYRMSFASLTLVIALGAALAQNINRPRARIKQVCLVVFMLLVVGYGFWNTWQLEPLERGVAEAESNLPGAVINFNEAVHRAPDLAIAYQQQGLAYSNQAASGSSGALEAAIVAFNQAVKLDPSWGLNSANLGALYLANGDLDRAEQSMQQAVKAAPDSGLFYLNLGLVEEARGNVNGATSAYSQALKLEPGYAPSYFWRSNSFRRGVFASAQTTITNPPVSITDMEHNIANGQTRAIDYAFLASLQIQAGQIDAAQNSMSLAHFAYLDNASDQLEIDWQDTEIAAARGDLETAVTTGEAILKNLLQQGVAGPNSYGQTQYAEQVFNVPAMAQDFVPQLTYITINDQWARRMLKLAAWAENFGSPDRAERIREALLRYIPDLNVLS